MSKDTRPVSIVHLLAPAPYGGLETVVVALTAGLAAAGDLVCVALVVSPDDVWPHPLCEQLVDRGVEVQVLTVAGRGYLDERKQVRSLLRQRNAQILHTHGFRPDLVDAPVARATGIPTVTTAHGFTGGSGRSRLYEWLQRRAFRSFDRVIAVSGKLGEELVAGGVPEQKLVTIRNAWQPEGPTISQSTARERLGLRSDALVVGWVGRMSREKAPDVFVRAAAATTTGSVTFCMVGAGPMMSESKALAAGFGVAERMHWPGSVGGAGDLLKAFDVVAITSWTEGTPMVLLEAMSAGVPIVTTSVGGIPDVLGSEEAVLCEPGNAAEIASGIDDVLMDPSAASRRAAKARQTVESRFAVDPWVQRHRELYHSLIESR